MLNASKIFGGYIMKEEKDFKKEVNEYISNQVQKELDRLKNTAVPFSLPSDATFHVNGLSGKYLGRDMANQGNSLSFPNLKTKEFFVKGMLDLISKSNNETTGSAGGYLVPTTITNEILRFGAQTSIALADCRIIPMTSDSHTVPVELSGITVTGEDEEAAINSSHPAFTEVELNARRYGAISTISNELMADSGVDLVSHFSLILSEAIGVKMDQLVFLGGDTFSGCLSGATNTQTIGTTAYSGIKAADLSLAMGQLNRSKLRDAKFYFSDKTVGVLRQEESTGGNYVFPPSTANSVYYGLPLVNTEVLPSPVTAATNFGLLGSLRQSYVLGVRTNALQLEIDPYGLFNTYQSRLRMVFRAHGKVAQGGGLVVFKTAT